MKTQQDRIEHHDCPADVAQRLLECGGLNRFNEPNFRVVWGYDRIVPIHGEWQEFEQFVATLTDRKTGYTEQRPFTKMVRSVIETREVPKYLPGNCWHLEMWRPPEEYGTPETWGKAGEEIVGHMTVSTSGPFPSRGEYELCYPLTSDGTSRGVPIPLVGSVVEEIVRMIQFGRNAFSFQQRKAAIEQRLRREDDGFVKKTEDVLRDALPPFAGEKFIVVPGGNNECEHSN